MSEKKGICYIIGACPDYCRDIKLTAKENDLVIAADGGYDLLNKNHIDADILLGDFDSISNVPQHRKIIKHPVKKDDTDTFLAYRTARDYGYKNFMILGGVGGRFDHTIANVQTLLNIANNGGRGFLIGKDCIMTTIKNSKIEFQEQYCGNISVFAQGNDAETVKIHGLKYIADGICLKADTPMGVSNEFVGERAEVSVENGAVLIIWEEDFTAFLQHIYDFTI